MLQTVEDIVDALGGNSRAAELAGVGLPAVSNWKSRSRIPAENFLIFSRELEKSGLSVDPEVFDIRSIAYVRTTV